MNSSASEVAARLLGVGNYDFNLCLGEREGYGRFLGLEGIVSGERNAAPMFFVDDYGGCCGCASGVRPRIRVGCRG